MNTAAMTDRMPAPAPQRLAKTNWPEPENISTAMATARDGGILFLTASTPKAKPTGT